MGIKMFRKIKTENNKNMSVGDNLILKGVVKKVLFHNESNGFIILSVEDKEQGISTIAKGVTAFSINEGSDVEIAGTVVDDPKFGMQLASDSIKSVIPTNSAAIIKYLSEAGISGIGKGIAERIVKEFGDKTFDIIDKDPDLLSTVKGIGKKRAYEISNASGQIRSDRDAVVFLSDLELSPTHIFHAIKEFGSNNIVAAVKENPYVLCKVFGIGFDKVDGIALNKLNIPKDHVNRIEALIVNHIEKETSFGSVAIKYPFKIRSKYGIPSEATTERIKAMVDDGVLVLDKGHAYLAEMFEYESGSAKKLVRLASSPSSFEKIRKDDIKAVAETKLGFPLDDSQLEAISNSIKSKASIITGGPGVGKTTVVSGLISVIESYGMEVFLCAPTGKAAKRMKETTGQEALTIHKLVGITKDGEAAFNSRNPHQGRCFVIDESSMLDTTLLFKFLDAVSDDAMVIFVGDVDQLPSVGPGAVLKDMIDSGSITTSKLTKIFRQAAESSIISNAHRINNKNPIEVDDKKDDFIFIETNSDEETIDELKYYIETMEACGNDVIDDVQILSPMRKGIVGINELNELLPDILNPNKSYRIGNLNVSVNDKVMQLANNYDKGVFNGDVGSVVDLKFDEYNNPSSLVVMFDDTLVDYNKKEIDELTLAYSYSVHKSQGSQYPTVVIPISKEHVFMWDKNLLYTAITRAESNVVLIGDKKTLDSLVKKDKADNRKTFLNERLNDEKELSLKREKFKKMSM